MSNGIESIHKELDVIMDKYSKAIENTMTAGHSFVTSRSAVDTGRYRAAWNLAVDRTNNATPADRGKPKGHSRGTDLYGVRRKTISFNAEKNTYATLSNNVEYAKIVDARNGAVNAALGYMSKALTRRINRI